MARAYNIEAERIGRVDFNVIPPAGGIADGGSGRGLHSFTFRLNVSASCRSGGSHGGCSGSVGGFRGY